MMKEIDKLAWFCIENGKILGARSKGKSLFYLPGGKRNPGESDEAALTREIQEELSVQLIQGSFRWIHTFYGPADGKPGVIVKLTCYAADYKGLIQASSEIEEVIFLSYTDRALCSEAFQQVMDWLKDKELL
jgi:8-oxo-dGTP diphosphatase